MPSQTMHSTEKLADRVAALAALESSESRASLDEFSQRLLAAVRRHLGMEIAFISQFVGDRRVFRYVDAANDATWIQPGDSDPREESYCQRVIDGRLPQLIRDAQRLPTAQDLRVTHELPVGAHLSVPIRLSDGSTFGTFCSFSRKGDSELDERSLAVMRVFADLAATFIERHRSAIAADETAQARIRSRIADGEPIAVCQPIVNLENRGIVGFEFLARFPGPPQGRPDEVFAEAAHAGQEHALTRTLINGVTEALDNLPAQSFVSLNLSPALVHSDGLEDLLAGLPLERLVIEITEHAVVNDYDAIGHAIAPLRARGARLAVDDAGAGYASFRHILSLSPDIVKLDMSLTRDVDTDRQRQALAAGLTEFARRGGYELVAEGIETPGELEMLRSFGQRLGQGFLFSRPARPETFRQ